MRPVSIRDTHVHELGLLDQLAQFVAAIDFVDVTALGDLGLIDKDGIRSLQEPVAKFVVDLRRFRCSAFALEVLVHQFRP